jgi:hypothetical protein
MMNEMKDKIKVVMNVNRKTDSEEMKQEIRAVQEHIKEIMETQFASQATKLERCQKL